jgi:hypothetical protein
MDDQFRFDCYEEDKARWTRAANQDGRSLASWCRARLNSAAEQELAAPKPVTPQAKKRRGS